MWTIIVLWLTLESVHQVIAVPRKDLEKCQEGVDIQNIENLAGVDVVTECPTLIEFLKCIEGVALKHTGLKLAELARLAPSTDAGKGAQLVSNGMVLLRDLCTNGSELNNAYKQHAECFGSITPDNITCLRDALPAYLRYRAAENAAGRYTGNENRQCMLEAYKSACTGAQVHQTCGQSAFELYQTVIKRFGMVRTLYCSSEGLEAVKTTFLDSLQLNEQQKNLFRTAFDLRR